MLKLSIIYNTAVRHLSIEVIKGVGEKSVEYETILVIMAESGNRSHSISLLMFRFTLELSIASFTRSTEHMSLRQGFILDCWLLQSFVCCWMVGGVSYLAHFKQYSFICLSMYLFKNIIFTFGAFSPRTFSNKLFIDLPTTSIPVMFYFNCWQSNTLYPFKKYTQFCFPSIVNDSTNNVII